MRPSFTAAGSTGADSDPPARTAPLTDDALTVDLASDAQVTTEAPLPADPEPGTVLGSRYQLEQIIGRGGTSVVYRARDLRPTMSTAPTGHVLALKFSHVTPGAVQPAPARLYREFRTMRGLDHPGIARVYEFGRDRGLWFMSMQLVVGRTLQAWMATGGTHAQALTIIRSCCEALDYAHSMGIVHGDLKPTNVLVTDEGTATLIDFGSSSLAAARANLGVDSTMAATPLYASPQILAGHRAEPLDDVFSLACLSYSILSGGRHPYGGHPSFEGFRAKSAPTYVSSIAPELFGVIERGLSADRERRPASVGDFWREFSAAEQRRHVAVALSQTDDVHCVPQSRPRRALWAAAGAAVVAAVAVACGAVVARHRSNDRSLHVSPATLQFPAMTIHASMLPVAPVPDPPAPAPAPTPKSAAPPHDSSSISFQNAIIHVSARQSLVAINVLRSPAGGHAGAFMWHVERGNAVPAVDYRRVKPQRVNFIEGQTTRTLFIALVPKSTARPPRGPRFFDVVLQPLAGGPALGRLARITVVIDPTPSVWVATSAPSRSAFR